MANNNWNNYTEKTATPVDADEVMVRDSADGKNKKLLFGTFWKWVAKKLNEATISELQTSNKTIVGALNQLNSDFGKAVSSSSEFITDFNEVKTTGFYYFKGDAKNAPTSTTAGNLIIIASNAAISQIAVVSNRLFIRRFAGSSWNEWAEK